MADKNIQMTQRNAANTAWDNLYPETGYVRSPAYGPAAGVVNAYTFAAMPAAALVDGMSVYLDNGIAANTGAATFNWSGLGAKAIVDAKGAALTAGKMPLNCIIGIRYNASITSFQLLGEGGEVEHGTQVYATAGTFSFTIPNNVTQLSIALIGGGGGSGRSAGSGGGSGAGGGGGGNVVFNAAVTPGAVHSIIVGAGGSGGIGTLADGVVGAQSTGLGYIGYGGNGGKHGITSGASQPGGNGGSGINYGVSGSVGQTYDEGGVGGAGSPPYNVGKGGNSTYGNLDGISGNAGKVILFW